MTDRVAELEGRVAALTEAQRALERRLAALERRPLAAAPRAAGARPPHDVTGSEVAADMAAATKHLALVGRTLLVLAGAFLLRAVTDTGTVPTWLGVGLGFCYAGVWILAAWRAGPRLPWSAGFHGLSAILVAYPLLVEATTRFRLLSPAAAAATLTAFTLVALAVAAQRRLQVLAWLVEAGGILAAVALMVAGGRLAPPVLFLIVVGTATLWLGYVLDWFYLRWPVALATDLAMVLVALRAVAPVAGEGPGTALLLQVLLLAAYLGSFAARTLLLHRAVVDFEGVQTVAVMLVGLGGAAFVTGQSGHGGPALGAVSALFGAATYAVAFAFIDRRQRGTTNFYFYSCVALVFTLTGSGLLLSGGGLGLGWAALAVVAGAGARTLRRLTLVVHAAIYGVLAGAVSGLFGHAAVTVLTSPLVAWPPLPAAALLVLGAMALCAWLTGDVLDAPPTAQQRLPRLLLLAALAAGAAGVLAGWLVPLLAGAPGPTASAGVAATVRTGVLVAGALTLAWGARFERWRETGWLAYPVLVVIGLKLVLEDIARSRPASLFLAFALYGTALILVPRLRRRGEAPRAAGADERKDEPRSAGSGR